MNLLLAVALTAASAIATPHLHVSTSNAQAQAAIDRGLFLYYAYDREASAQAFARAAALDPHLAMAYWGMALAEGPDLNTPITPADFERAAHAAATALSLEAPSALERQLVSIMSARYRRTFADWRADDAAYRRTMLALAESSGDENVALLAAEALLEHGGLDWRQGEPANDESRAALALVAGVLRTDPSSVMANHLCIHLYDLAPDRTAALACTKRLDAARFAPEAEHLAHMPAHYWIETGDYAKALASSERAYALIAQLEARDPTSDHVQQYLKHDVAVGYSAATMLGNYANAQRWSERMTFAFGTSFDGLTALRFGRYDDAYAATPSDYAGVSVRGIAAVHVNQIGEARVLAARLGDPSRGYLPQIFLAELAMAQGEYSEALHWIDVSRANQRNDFQGELIPIVPADEVLGTLLLRRGDAAGAVEAFRATLATYPKDPRALFGLAQALDAAGNRDEAASTRVDFQRAWEGADTNVAGALL